MFLIPKQSLSSIPKYITSQRTQAFANVQFPFGSFDTRWEDYSSYISTRALKDEVIESLEDAHDMLKAYIADLNYEKLEFIMRPQLFHSVKQILEQIEEEQMNPFIIQQENIQTKIHKILLFDQFFYVRYGEDNVKERFNIYNMMKKDKFKKLLFKPKEGFFQTPYTILVVQCLFRTNLKLALMNKDKKIKTHISQNQYEDYLIEFTTKNWHVRKPMIVDPEIQGATQDLFENGWKISNINKIIPDQDDPYEHVLCRTPVNFNLDEYNEEYAQQH